MATKSTTELRQQVGQLMIMGFDGTALSARLRSVLGTFQPGGVILFKRNIEEALQVHALLRDSQKAVATQMFRCVDLEGGTVDRLRDVIAPAPSVTDVSATGSKKLFRKHGQVIGEEVRALGLNTDFAPSLDLAFEASKSVLRSRTVSPDPKKTVRFAREYLRGLRAAGVLGCGKHFPGLGEASLDSHLDLPSIDKPWKKLWGEDLVPYREMRKDLPFVMVAHACYPAVTGDRAPASLSRKWMTDVLRKKIGYRGLVVSDDLDMGAVLSSASIEEAAVETLRAGADMFLVCQKEEHVWRAFEAAFKKAESDKKFARLVVEKSARVLAFKRKSREIAARMAPPPSAKTVDRLRRQMWEFSEEVRVNCARRDTRMIVAGVMSGTSADGVDVAIVRFSGRRFRTRFELLAHAAFPYPTQVRAAVLQAMNADSIAVSTLARLNFLLAEIYADCVSRLQRRSGIACELVGCHGQTLYHQGETASFLGRKIACTWQTGDGSVLAARLGMPVVSDFRPADMAAGGLGAPLVPFLDLRYSVIAATGPHRAEHRWNRQPDGHSRGGHSRAVRAFDTGPGNMVIDAVTEHLFERPFDRNGRPGCPRAAD